LLLSKIIIISKKSQSSVWDTFLQSNILRFWLFKNKKITQSYRKKVSERIKLFLVRHECANDTVNRTLLYKVYHKEEFVFCCCCCCKRLSLFQRTVKAVFCNPIFWVFKNLFTQWHYRKKVSEHIKLFLCKWHGKPTLVFHFYLFAFLFLCKMYHTELLLLLS